jgi:hypothetical protein
VAPGRHVGVSPAVRTALAAGLTIFLGLIIGATIYAARVENRSNLVVFDGNPRWHARVDGKDFGALAQKDGSVETALVVALTPGAHTVEIVDAQGNVIEKGWISSVPAHGYRALYAAGNTGKVAKVGAGAVGQSDEPTGYAFVQVGYGEVAEGDEVTPMRAEEPHVYVVPAGAFLSKHELELVHVPFPKSTRAQSPFTRHGICRLNADGDPDCL